MLRARSMTGETRERVSRPFTFPTPRIQQHQEDPFEHPDPRRSRDAASRRGGLRLALSLSRVIRCLLLLAISLYAVRVYIGHSNRNERGVLDLASPASSSGEKCLDEQLGTKDSDGFAAYLEKGEPGRKQLKADKPRWKIPLVDRSVLDKLERMGKFFAPDFYDLVPAYPPLPKHRSQWPPRVAHIPEAPHRPGHNAHHTPENSAICASAAHPRACRFLLPLRISEQESKARIHLTQVARLARELNRTLVLPQVGKSKIGACFKWELGAYYDVPSLGVASARPSPEVAGEAGPDSGAEANAADTVEEEPDSEWFVELDDFNDWLAEHSSGMIRKKLTSQLVSVGPGLPADVSFRTDLVYSNQDVSVYGYNTFGAWERDLPGCFASKFRALALETMPVFMSTPSSVGKDGGVRMVGDSVVEAFRAVSDPRVAPLVDGEAPAQAEYTSEYTKSGVDGSTPSLSPEVLVVNWDLRQPIFGEPPTLYEKGLQYSQYMHEIAERYAPSSGFLVVHWRMETVDYNVLDACAHSLVDVLHRILHDSALSSEITTVWFASDYPRPISRKRKPVHHESAKSGTFRDVDPKHDEAVDILRTAFEEGGDLSDWRLIDLMDAVEEDGDEDEEFLKDSGALGIVDKLISMNANVFVSGSRRCSRRSSFTKQVIETRRERVAQDRTASLQNIVDVFG